MKNLQTAAGQISTTSTSTEQQAKNSSQPGSQSSYAKADILDAVNFTFMLMRDAFPQQFINAFPSQDSRDRARSLWAKGLADLHPQLIKKAAIKSIKESKFLPSLSALRQLCETRYEDLGLKDPLQAYYEACRATNRTREGFWSHLAVYLAAKETGWQLLEGEPQNVALPVFERNYEILCNRIVAGENLEGEMFKALENHAQMDELRKAQIAAEKKLRKDMKQHGINPDGGRDEFLRMMEDL
nr:replication protein P [Sansalvadorimonas sp. 2012CJ34-2]